MTIPWSRSLYRITIGGTDVSSRLAPWLIKVETEDATSSTSDAATIELDDGIGGRFVLPPKGSAVTIDLGSEGRGLARRFTGSVDTTKWRLDRGGGRRLEIHAKGMDTSSEAKQPSRRHWDDATLATVMDEAARACGLDGCAVHGDLAAVTRDWWAMDGESFVAFGHRLAADHGATFKVVGRRALLVPRGAGVSASGRDLAPVLATVGDNVLSVEIAPDSGRPRYKTVKARHYDRAEARWKEVEAEVDTGGDDTVGATETLAHDRADADTAHSSARAEARDSERQKGGGPVEIDGDPTAVAGAPCILSGCRPGIDGMYEIATVKDTLDRRGGYVTRLDLVKPDAAVGKDARRTTKTP